jgi:hypothetical protein
MREREREREREKDCYNDEQVDQKLIRTSWSEHRNWQRSERRK